MSFFSKIKQFAGIGTLDVRVEGPASLTPGSTEVQGRVHITAKSDQQVLSIVVELREEFKSGRGDEQKEQRFVLGSLRLGEQYALREGETRAVPFSFPIQFLKSNNDTLKEKGGLLGGLGKLGALAANEQSTFKLHAVVDVQGTSLDPTGELDVKFIK